MEKSENICLSCTVIQSWTGNKRVPKAFSKVRNKPKMQTDAKEPENSTHAAHQQPI